MFLYFFSLTIAVLGLTFYHIAQKSTAPIGIFVFREKLNFYQILGLDLSIAGLILLNKK